MGLLSSFSFDAYVDRIEAVAKPDWKRVIQLLRTKPVLFSNMRYRCEKDMMTYMGLKKAEASVKALVSGEDLRPGCRDALSEALVKELQRQKLERQPYSHNAEFYIDAACEVMEVDEEAGGEGGGDERTEGVCSLLQGTLNLVERNEGIRCVMHAYCWHLQSLMLKDKPRVVMTLPRVT